MRTGVPRRPLRGRERELGLLSELTDPDTGPRSVVLLGAPGMGKSRLWTEGVSLGRRAGLRVIATTCVAPEAEMPYVGLLDLLGDLVDEHVDALPAPQRHAVAQALSRAESSPGPGGVPERTVAAGVLSLLRRTVADRPLLLAIDDHQWLDIETERALAYAARRLQDQNLHLLLAAREDLVPSGPAVLPTDSTGGQDSPLSQAFEHRRIVHLGPLEPEAAQHMLADRRGVRIPLEDIRELVASTGGNPFWLLEFTRDGHDPTDRRVSSSLTALIADRLRDLDRTTEAVTALVAALGRPRISTVRAAARAALPEITEDDLEPALDTAVGAELLATAGDRLEFTHPLVEAAILAAVPPFRRCRLHRCAAEHADTPEQRAHHLLRAHALFDPTAGGASSGADRESADADTLVLLRALDDAAATARRRGAPVSATRFAQRALALAQSIPSVPAAEVAARAVTTSELQLSISDYPQAFALAQQLDLAALSDDLFSRAAPVLADSCLRLQGPYAAAELLSSIESGPGHESGSRRAAVTVLRANPFIAAGDWIALAEQAATATGNGNASADLRRRALGRLLHARLFSARRPAASPVEQVLSDMAGLDRVTSPVAASESTPMLRALFLFYDDQLDDAHAAFTVLERQLLDAGDDFGAALAGFMAAYADFLAGRIHTADRHLDEIVHRTDRAELHLPELDGLLGLRGQIRLALGDLDGTQRLLAEEQDEVTTNPNYRS